MPDSSILDELPPLDDQDVEALYNIVSYAQRSHERPYKALFEARDAVLELNGDREHNSKYLRFLLKAGSELTKNGTQGLVERFRGLLTKLGIQLVFNDEDDPRESQLSDEDRSAQRDEGRPVNQDRGRTLNSTRNRRASFNDSNLDTTWISGDRPNEQVERLRPQSSHRVPAMTRTESKDRNTELSQKGRSDRSRKASQQVDAPGTRPRRARSTSTQGSVRIFRPAHVTTHATSDQKDQTSSSQFTLELLARPVDVASLLYRPTEVELVADADAFFLSRVGHRVIHTWHDQALQRGTSFAELEQVASNHDRRILLRQSLAQMRDSLSDKGFWSLQERRAGRARDIFLLTKAFTHWAQTASDEVFKTSVARRHILRTRYFNAWRDITVVNELKSRRLGLRKWFGQWRAKTSKRSLDNEMALAIHEERLAERSYWKWFWTFCERKAPVWKDARVQKSCLEKLVGTYRTRSVSQMLAQDLSVTSAKKRCLHNLAAKLQKRILDTQSAETSRRHHLLSENFHIITIQMRLAPLERQFSTSYKDRCETKALLLWHLQAQQSAKALNTDRLRLLKSVWSRWNDRLRYKSLAVKIDERVLVQSLYKWVLKERLGLHDRIEDQRLKSRSIHRMSSVLATQHFRLNEAAMIYKQGEHTRLMRSTMLKFHRSCQVAERAERMATEFRNVRDLRQILDLWKEKTTHARQLNRWASDARFFCLTTRAIKSWKEATENAQRNKRKEAYAAVRRRGKMALVQGCLRVWHDRTTHVGKSSATANDRYQRRLQRLHLTEFDVWHQKARTYLEQSRKAERLTAERLFDTTMDRMTSTLERARALQEKARLQASENTDRSASKLFKKIGDTLFLLRRQEETALAWRERKFGQHRRTMLRYWAYETAHRRALQDVGDPDSPTKRDRGLFSSLRLPSARKSDNFVHVVEDSKLPLDFDDDDDFSATQRAEQWTQFNFVQNPLPTLEENPDSAKQYTVTPLPGYLRTPSRRTRARFKPLNSRMDSTARVNGTATRPATDFGTSFLSSTTPAPLAPGGVRDMETLTPQITPFDRKLRAGGYGGETTTPLTAPPGKGRFGQSRFGKGSDSSRTVRFGNPEIEAQGLGRVQEAAAHEKSS